ncbi:LuxR C-terminal-related transcriptional regulator [Hyphomonas sp. WL0036]|uniref:helix-turn-helix transcriptional regulator n=1 Tax=Hyphomonas sediminis TaxID=2866160 RepID=UPI001C7F243A|nr:LuxR C-terminal-related transcriptional regulator [Hyphomonas sediminis]MBY9068161.1 LuxR C-terminal-related transcriptional regulator [Hyphomonas sediminis]
MNRTISDFLLELYSNASECLPNELRLRTLKSLQSALPFDFAVWGGGSADGRLVTDLTVLDQTTAVLEEWEAIASADAFCDLTLQRLGATARFDDVPKYRKSMAYNEHWRKFDATHMMATISAEGSDGYVSFVGLCAKSRQTAFSDKEKAFKQTLMPHLSQALRMNREIWTGRAALKHEAVALIDHDGWILSSQGPFELFARDEWSSVGRIPAEAMRKIRSGQSWHGQTVTVRPSPFEDKHFIHIRHQPTRSVLSPRERQVAELFASGLTNKEVARTLGTAPSTVRNQLERIYDKLEIGSKSELVALFNQY